MRSIILFLYVFTFGLNKILVYFPYTDGIEGWQYRWFTVDAQSGTLSYYLCDSSASSSSASMIGGMGSCDDSPPPNLIGNSPRWQVIDRNLTDCSRVLGEARASLIDKIYLYNHYRFVGVFSWSCYLSKR